MNPYLEQPNVEVPCRACGAMPSEPCDPRCPQALVAQYEAMLRELRECARQARTGATELERQLAGSVVVAMLLADDPAGRAA